MDTITVLGAGYVGLTTSVLLANSGYKVFLIEPNPKRLNVIKTGKSFFYEVGINPLLSKAIKDGTLIPTDSYEESVPNSRIVFSCVGTPDNPDGSSNLSYVFSAAESTAKLMKPGTVFVQKSTVPVGTGLKVIEAMKAHQKDFQYVSNPEFLREGTAVFDSLYFDRIVVGGESHKANQSVMDVYLDVESSRAKLAKLAGIKSGQTNGGYIETSLNSAELIKVTSNAFLALKISFANNIAKLADHTDADVIEIMDGIGADPRIGRAFLDAGRGYGGGCFPKDVSGLISSAEEYGVDLPIMTAASDVNDSMAGYIANKAKKSLGTLEGKKFAVLGLAFKAGTSDVRRSPGIKLANILSKNGAEITAYDPQANGEAEEELRSVIVVEKSIETAVKDVDAVFVTTAWPEILGYDLKKLAKLMSGDLLVDGVNGYDKTDAENASLKYIGVGR